MQRAVSEEVLPGTTDRQLLEVCLDLVGRPASVVVMAELRRRGNGAEVGAEVGEVVLKQGWEGMAVLAGFMPEAEAEVGDLQTAITRVLEVLEATESWW